jgi:hypothetical protein
MMKTVGIVAVAALAASATCSLAAKSTETEA